MQILEVGKGTIQPGTGMAEFVVKYRAIVYRPFKGETVDGTVGIVNKASLCVADKVCMLTWMFRWASLRTLVR
jgi:DNA-directed RNA polymerase II subunit RPB7